MKVTLVVGDVAASMATILKVVGSIKYRDDLERTRSSTPGFTIGAKQ